MRRNLLNILFLYFIFCLSITESSGQIVKKGIDFPNAGIYKVLKCDFHTHTIFSDGEVWPTMRMTESASEDLDAISITDHVEYRPHLDDLTARDHNRSYEIAKTKEKAANVILIHGTEITRAMPPGHLNAIFIEDANVFQNFVNEKDSRDGSNIIETLEAARLQKSYIFWNHPSFPGPSDTAKLYPVHEEMIKKKLIDGIEVVNGPKYEPEAFQWCLDYNLAVIGTSDIHRILSQDLVERGMLHRSITLVLATERTPESIRKALDDRRTIAVCNYVMYGKTENVKPVFESAVNASLIGDYADGNIEFTNSSDFPFDISIVAKDASRIPKTMKLQGHSKIIISLKNRNTPSQLNPGDTLSVKVRNIFIAPDKEFIHEFSL